eukprot:UN4560
MAGEWKKAGEQAKAEYKGTDKHKLNLLHKTIYRGLVKKSKSKSKSKVAAKAPAMKAVKAMKVVKAMKAVAMKKKSSAMKKK